MHCVCAKQAYSCTWPSCDPWVARPPQELGRGPMAAEDTWEVVRGILKGLAYIHSQGVIHRDLKVRAVSCAVL